MDGAKQRFAMTHIIVLAILFIYMFLGIITEPTMQGLYGLLAVTFIWLLDAVVYFMQIYNKRTALIVIRYIEIIFISLAFVFSIQTYTSVLLVVFLAIMIFEMLFLFDYTDIYTRTITTGVSIFPFICFLIIRQMSYSDYSESGAVEMICVIIMIIVFVAQISGILVSMVTSYERRVFEQRRLTENAKDMNETLKLHQEKIKKANEELGIQKIKLESANRKVNRVNAETLTQNEILKYISSTLDINDLVENITIAVKKSLSLDFCAIMIYPSAVHSKKKIYRISTTLSQSFEQGFYNELLQGKFDEFVEQKEVTICTMYQCRNVCLLSEGAVSSMLIAPILSNNNVFGVLYCGHSRQDFFDESTGLFENITAQVMMALNNANLYAKVQQLAIRDGLTGIYNRRYLNELFKKLSDEEKVNNDALSAALIDIDHFKSFNDSYGHLFGDYVLRKLSELIDTTVNEHGGIASRYGGEEFVLVFPGKNSLEVYNIVGSLQRAINSMPLDNEGVFVQVRVSIGITSYPEICKSPDEVLNRADLAMYYSKEHGRNKITIDNDEVHDFFRAKNSEYINKGKVKAV